MATRLSVKSRKRTKDRKRAYAAGEAPKRCKIALARSTKAKAKSYNNK